MTPSITLYYTTSIDGFVADPDGNTPWSASSWRTYLQHCRQNPNVIMGKRTYELFIQDSSIYSLPLNTKLVVSGQSGSVRNDFIQVKSPGEAIKALSARGITDALLLGGPTTATSFLSEGLISRVRLDIDPKILGAGLPMFLPGTKPCDLDLRLVTSVERSSLVFEYELLTASSRGSRNT